MASARDIIFGRLFLARAQTAPAPLVQQCLEGTGPNRSLADVLVVRGLLTQRAADYLSQCAAHMEFMRSEMLFARILLRRRWASYFVIQRGMALQEREGFRERLGDLLLRTGRIAPQVYEAASAEHLLALAEDTERLLSEGVAPRPDADEALSTLAVRLDDIGPPRAAPPPRDPQGQAVASAGEAAPTLEARSFAEALPELTETDEGHDFAGEVQEYRARKGLPPLEALNSSELSPERIQRAFDAALLMAGVDGTLLRKRPQGRAPSKPCRVIYDAARDVFKAPLAPAFELGDEFVLEDGSRWRVEHVDVFRRLGTNCYQQILASERSVRG